jgi:ferredoxin
MPKLYNNYKKISFGEFDNQATEYIGELVHEMLAEKGINPSSYLVLKLNMRRMKMSECKYCGGNCPEQVDKNGDPRQEYICDDYSGLMDFIRSVKNEHR